VMAALLSQMDYALISTSNAIMIGIRGTCPF